MENTSEKKEAIQPLKKRFDNLSNSLNALGPEMVVISDECGDTMWEAVLAQGNEIYDEGN